MSEEIERMVVSRTLPASRDVVWRAWTEPEYVKQWWGPHGFTSPTCNIDLRVGGRFLTSMKTPDGQEFWNAGEYHEIIPREKIVMSMYFSDPEGNRVEPAQYGIEHEAIENAYDVVTFQDAGEGQTIVTFTGNETREDAAESGQLEGMNQVFEKFGTVVAQLVQSQAR